MATKEVEKVTTTQFKQDKKLASWKDTIKEASSAILVVTGMLYVLGMFVVSIGLSFQCGQWICLPLVRVRYIMVGFGAMLYMMLGNVLPLLLVPKWFTGAPYRSPSLVTVLHHGMIIISLPFLLSVPACVWFLIFGDRGQLSLETMIPLLAMNIIGLCFYYGYFRSKPLPLGYRSAVLLLACLWLEMLIVYAVTAYPLISSSAGGGRPSIVRLNISTDSAKSSTGPGYISIEADGWTRTILLLDWTDDFCLVQIPDVDSGQPPSVRTSETRKYTFLAIKKAEIRCIEYLPKFNRPRS